MIRGMPREVLKEFRRLNAIIRDRDAQILRLKAELVIFNDPWYWDNLDPRKQKKLNQLRVALQQLNLKLSRALDEPGVPPGTTTTKENGLMATIDEALEAVRSASTRTDSIIADRAAIKKQLEDALANVNLPADVQAKIDEILDIEKSDAEKIDAALNANVPPPTT